MEVDHVGFRELTKPAVLKKTPSGMLHLFYPPRKPETQPETARNSAVSTSRLPLFRASPINQILRTHWIGCKEFRLLDCQWH
jgi:hypothetical protein